MATLLEDDLTVKSLTIGTTSAGAAAAALAVNKTGAGTASFNLKAANVLRGQLILDASENVAVKALHTDGTTVQGSLTIAQASGMATLSNGLTVTAGGAVVTDGTTTLSETGALSLAVDGLPLASTTVPLVRIGGTALVGGAAAGTFLGMNTADATTADLVHLQNNDTTEFKVSSAGAGTFAAGLTIGGALAGATTVNASGLATLGSITSAGTVTLTGATIVGLHEHITLDIANLVGGDAKVYGINCPVAGTITRIASRLNGAALTTGNATITGAIAATPITDGAITITQGGSAEGDLDAVTPSAANTVAVGSNLNFTVGGTNDATGAFATLTITVLRSA
jgi:hypothetical protein